MATLCIDIGNTLIKAAVFHNNKLIDFHPVDAQNNDELSRLITRFNVDAAILSSVAAIPENLLELLRSLNTFIVLDHTTPLPIENLYETKESLGKDRIAAVVGAHFLYPDNDLLVIDAGTAITYDIITAKGQYLGGNIAPGLQMRFKALSHFTSRLPLLEPRKDIPPFGKNTNEAIQTGVQQGILCEADGFINLYEVQFPGLKAVFTGGDANFFDKKLKSTIFVVSNLVMIGLNRILIHNT